MKLLGVFLPQVVHQSPRAMGLARGRWPLQALQDEGVRQMGKGPSLESIPRALRFGYSWKRAKRTVTTARTPSTGQKRGSREAGGQAAAGGGGALGRPGRHGAVSAGEGPVGSPGSPVQDPHPWTLTAGSCTRASGPARTARLSWTSSRSCGRPSQGGRSLLSWTTRAFTRAGASGSS